MNEFFVFRVFDEHGAFNKDELEEQVEAGRRRFVIYFPQNIEQEALAQAAAFFTANKAVVHAIERSTLCTENEVRLGRTMLTLYELKRMKVDLRSMSISLSSIEGFGKTAEESCLEKHFSLKLRKGFAKERFFASTFGKNDYIKNLNENAVIFRAVKTFCNKLGIRLLVTNKSADYIFVTRKYKEHFERAGYSYGKAGGVDTGEPGRIPLLMEKGYSPRTAKEMKSVCAKFGVKLALDMESLHISCLLSKKYNAKNKDFMRRWKVKIGSADREMFARCGFTIQNGKPIIYEKELDFIDEVLSLKRQLFIALLSTGPSPVFLDKEDLTEEELDNDKLLGILDKSDIPYAVSGEDQIAGFGAVRNTDYIVEDMSLEDEEDMNELDEEDLFEGDSEKEADELQEGSNEEEASPEDGESEEDDDEASELNEFFTTVEHDMILQNEAAVNVWNKMFTKHFGTQLAVLKEVEARNFINKVPEHNENVSSTLRMFKFAMENMI